MSERLFWLMNLQDETCAMEFTSSAPREAALKAATRGYQNICLVDTTNGKLHIFRGDRIALSDADQNEFTRARNINTKPSVSKMAYRNLNRPIAKTDIEAVCAELCDMMQ